MIANRRHRHLTLRPTGAALQLDARAITGLADAAAVSSWADTSGNSRNATQATAANQPTFRTAGLGSGLPSVRFDGATTPNQDWLGINSISVSQPITFVGLWKPASGVGTPYLFDDQSGTSRVIAGMDLATGIPNGFLATLSGASVLIDSADSRGLTHIFSGRFSGSNSIALKNGVQFASGNAGSNNMATLKIGERFSNFNNTSQLNGDIGCIFIIATSSAPLRRRFEHAAAYSFKIPCS